MVQQFSVGRAGFIGKGVIAKILDNLGESVNRHVHHPLADASCILLPYRASFYCFFLPGPAGHVSPPSPCELSQRRLTRTTTALCAMSSRANTRIFHPPRALRPPKLMRNSTPTMLISANI